MNKTYAKFKEGDCFKDQKNIGWIKIEDGQSRNSHWFIVDENDFEEDEILTQISKEEFNADSVKV